MSARVEAVQTLHKGNFIGAPDIERRRDGRWLLCERFQVHVSPSLGAWVWVEGRAIRADGSIGTATLGEGFDLDNRGRDELAPEWLVEALKAAGVTW